MEDHSEIIDVEVEPKRKVAVLRHADADGFGAAYAIWKALKDTCELLFMPVQYSQEPPLDQLKEFGPDKIFIVDFSYDANTLMQIQYEVCTDLTVIDHHKTALSHLQEWLPVLSVNPGYGSYFFDTERSGAVHTWDLFHLDPDWVAEEAPIDELHPSALAPEILLYVQDRDLWQWNLEHSKEINAFIATLPEDFEEWDNFYTPQAYDCGKAILAFQGKQIQRALKGVVMVPWGNIEGFGASDSKPMLNHWLIGDQLIFQIPFVNASENISELGEAMCLAYPDAPFSVSYCDRPDGKRSYSLRSRNGFDVSEVCKAFGGGGHPAAGGFTLPSPQII